MSYQPRERNPNICVHFYLLYASAIFSAIFFYTQSEVLKSKYSCPPLGLPNSTIKDLDTCRDPSTNTSAPADLNEHAYFLQYFVCLPTLIIAVGSVALVACLLELTIRQVTMGNTPIQRYLSNFLYELPNLDDSQPNLSTKPSRHRKHDS